MKRVLIIICANISVHGRALKEIMALKSDYQIDTIGTDPACIEGVGFFQIVSSPRLSLYKKALLAGGIVLGDYCGCMKTLEIAEHIKGENNILKPDVIIAHNADGLFIANTICERKEWTVPIVLNMHEYLPLQNASLKNRFLDKPFIEYLKAYGPKVDAIYTVADGIARKYEKFLGLKSGTVQVTYNAPFYNNELAPHKTKNTIRLVSHGLAAKDRKLEMMIDAMRLLPKDKYSLDLYLVDSDKEYYEKLIRMVDNLENVHICKPVSYDKITTMLNQYDVLFYSIYPSSFNSLNCLPNKFFEAVQGRLAIVIGPSPEMKTVLDKYNLGISSNKFSAESLAECIQQLTPKMIDNYKCNSDKNAYLLSAETAMDKIRHIVEEVV